MLPYKPAVHYSIPKGDAMQLGMIGLGRMGSGMRQRLQEAGHEILGYDKDSQLSDTQSLRELVLQLTPPRNIWIMVPAGEATTTVITHLSRSLTKDDLVIDGGNTHYKQDRWNSELLAAKGIGFVDAGVSGGVWGPQNGYGLMVGGPPPHIERLMPVFDALRPDGPREESFVHAGDVGAGHFAKMVHNGIEYGLMQAYAEGFELLQAADVVNNVPAVVKAWQRGTVIRSWLLELLVAALDKDPELAKLRGVVQDSGEGRWTVEAAIKHAVPLPVISAALFARFASRQDNSPAMRAVAALRQQFGGHAIQATEQPASE